MYVQRYTCPSLGVSVGCVAFVCVCANTNIVKLVSHDNMWIQILGFKYYAVNVQGKPTIQNTAWKDHKRKKIV